MCQYDSSHWPLGDSKLCFSPSVELSSQSGFPPRKPVPVCTPARIFPWIAMDESTACYSHGAETIWGSVGVAGICFRKAGLNKCGGPRFLVSYSDWFRKSQLKTITWVCKRVHTLRSRTYLIVRFTLCPDICCPLWGFFLEQKGSPWQRVPFSGKELPRLTITRSGRFRNNMHTHKNKQKISKNTTLLCNHVSKQSHLQQWFIMTS